MEVALGCVCIPELCFCTRILAFSCLALNGWFRAFSFRRLRYERCRLYASGLGAGGTGPGLDGAQSHGGRRDRKGRRGHRSGLARAHTASSTRSGTRWPPARPTPPERPCMSRWSPVATTGKQPPCVEAILEAGIRRVVVGSADPNPLVAAKGVALLRSHGVEVTENVLQEECDALNRIFFHYITTGWPFVSMKYAMTMDGKIAACTGASKWVTGETARSHVQQQRHRFRGIMVGVGTVLADDPLLTCRMENGRDPVRIICDTNLRTPPQAQVVVTADQIPDYSRHLLYQPGKAGGVPARRMPGDLPEGEKRSCRPPAADGTAGTGADRQYFAGGRRNAELGRAGVRNCAAGAGIYRARSCSAEGMRRPPWRGRASSPRTPPSD